MEKHGSLAKAARVRAIGATRWLAADAARRGARLPGVVAVEVSPDGGVAVRFVDNAPVALPGDWVRDGNPRVARLPDEVDVPAGVAPSASSIPALLRLGTAADGRAEVFAGCPRSAMSRCWARRTRLRR
jgi:hypothetical protein